MQSTFISKSIADTIARSSKWTIPWESIPDTIARSAKRTAMNCKTNDMTQNLGGLSPGAVTAVTRVKFSFGLCVTARVKKAVTKMAEVVTKRLQSGYKAVIRNLDINLKYYYVKRLQSGYVQFSFKLGCCNRFFTARISPLYFREENDE